MIKWLKLLSTFKLPANYFKIDGSVKAEPSSLGTQVLRLDENAAVIDTRQQAHPMVAAMMPWIMAGIGPEPHRISWCGRRHVERCATG